METSELCTICKKEKPVHSVTAYSGFEVRVCEECYQNIKKFGARDETKLREERRGFLAKIIKLFS
jgi:ribosome-binding protein aMBF1 (putative translation factor)